MRPHRVLHILGTAGQHGAGIAHLVGGLARGLDPERYRLHALFLAGDGPLVSDLEQAGAQASVIDWVRGARDPVGAWRFWRHLRNQKFEIVHVHFGGRSVLRLARAATGAKIVLHVWAQTLEPKGVTPVHYSARGTDMVVAASQALASQVVDGPAQVIYAGVDIPPIGPPTHGEHATSQLIIGTAGRLIRIKGIESLLDAAAVLQAEFPELRVEIAGTGPERENLEQRAARLGLAGRVEFLGWVDDPNSILPRWDVFVIPSLEEGFGIAALQAMAVGLPVVASTVGGLPEIVEDGITGWLVPPGNVEELASRLRLLLSSQEVRLRMGAAAQARVRDHFSSAQMAKNFTHLYDNLLGETGT